MAQLAADALSAAAREDLTALVVAAAPDGVPGARATRLVERVRAALERGALAAVVDVPVTAAGDAGAIYNDAAQRMAFVALAAGDAAATASNSGDARAEVAAAAVDSPPAGAPPPWLAALLAASDDGASAGGISGGDARRQPLARLVAWPVPPLGRTTSSSHSSFVSPQAAVHAAAHAALAAAGRAAAVTLEFVAGDGDAAAGGAVAGLPPRLAAGVALSHADSLLLGAAPSPLSTAAGGTLQPLAEALLPRTTAWNEGLLAYRLSALEAAAAAVPVIGYDGALERLLAAVAAVEPAAAAPSAIAGAAVGSAGVAAHSDAVAPPPAPGDDDVDGEEDDGGDAPGELPAPALLLRSGTFTADGEGGGAAGVGLRASSRLSGRSGGASTSSSSSASSSLRQRPPVLSTRSSSGGSSSALPSSASAAFRRSDGGASASGGGCGGGGGSSVLLRYSTGPTDPVASPPPSLASRLSGSDGSTAFSRASVTAAPNTARLSRRVLLHLGQAAALLFRTNSFHRPMQPSSALSVGPLSPSLSLLWGGSSGGGASGSPVSAAHSSYAGIDAGAAAAADGDDGGPLEWRAPTHTQVATAAAVAAGSVLRGLPAVASLLQAAQDELDVLEPVMHGQLVPGLTAVGSSSGGGGGNVALPALQAGPQLPLPDFLAHCTRLEAVVATCGAGSPVGSPRPTASAPTPAPAQSTAGGADAAAARVAALPASAGGTAPARAAVLTIGATPTSSGSDAAAATSRSAGSSAGSMDEYALRSRAEHLMTRLLIGSDALTLLTRLLSLEARARDAFMRHQEELEREAEARERAEAEAAATAAAGNDGGVDSSSLLFSPQSTFGGIAGSPSPPPASVSARAPQLAFPALNRAESYALDSSSPRYHYLNGGSGGAFDGVDDVERFSSFSGSVGGDGPAWLQVARDAPAHSGAGALRGASFSSAASSSCASSDLPTSDSGALPMPGGGGGADGGGGLRVVTLPSPLSGAGGSGAGVPPIRFISPNGSGDGIGSTGAANQFGASGGGAGGGPLSSDERTATATAATHRTIATVSSTASAPPSMRESQAYGASLVSGLRVDAAGIAAAHHQQRQLSSSFDSATASGSGTWATPTGGTSTFTSTGATPLGWASEGGVGVLHRSGPLQQQQQQQHHASALPPPAPIPVDPVTGMPLHRTVRVIEFNKGGGTGSSGSGSGGSKPPTPVAELQRQQEQPASDKGGQPPRARTRSPSPAPLPATTADIDAEAPPSPPVLPPTLPLVNARVDSAALPTAQLQQPAGAEVAAPSSQPHSGSDGSQVSSFQVGGTAPAEAQPRQPAAAALAAAAAAPAVPSPAIEVLDDDGYSSGGGSNNDGHDVVATAVSRRLDLSASAVSDAGARGGDGDVLGGSLQPSPSSSGSSSYTARGRGGSMFESAALPRGGGSRHDPAAAALPARYPPAASPPAGAAGGLPPPHTTTAGGLLLSPSRPGSVSISGAGGGGGAPSSQLPSPMGSPRGSSSSSSSLSRVPSLILPLSAKKGSVASGLCSPTHISGMAAAAAAAAAGGASTSAAAGGGGATSVPVLTPHRSGSVTSWAGSGTASGGGTPLHSPTWRGALASARSLQQQSSLGHHQASSTGSSSDEHFDVTGRDSRSLSARGGSGGRLPQPRSLAPSPPAQTQPQPRVPSSPVFDVFDTSGSSSVDRSMASLQLDGGGGDAAPDGSSGAGDGAGAMPVRRRPLMTTPPLQLPPLSARQSLREENGLPPLTVSTGRDRQNSARSSGGGGGGGNGRNSARDVLRFGGIAVLQPDSDSTTATPAHQHESQAQPSQHQAFALGGAGSEAGAVGLTPGDHNLSSDDDDASDYEIDYELLAGPPRMRSPSAPKLLIRTPKKGTPLLLSATASAASLVYPLSAGSGGGGAGTPVDGSHGAGGAIIAGQSGGSGGVDGATSHSSNASSPPEALRRVAFTGGGGGSGGGGGTPKLIAMRSPAGSPPQPPTPSHVLRYNRFLSPPPPPPGSSGVAALAYASPSGSYSSCLSESPSSSPVKVISGSADPALLGWSSGRHHHRGRQQLPQLHEGAPASDGMADDDAAAGAASAPASSEWPLMRVLTAANLLLVATSHTQPPAGSNGDEAAALPSQPPPEADPLAPAVEALPWAPPLDAAVPPGVLMQPLTEWDTMPVVALTLPSPRTEGSVAVVAGAPSATETSTAAPTSATTTTTTLTYLAARQLSPLYECPPAHAAVLALAFTCILAPGGTALRKAVLARMSSAHNSSSGGSHAAADAGGDGDRDVAAGSGALERRYRRLFDAQPVHVLQTHLNHPFNLGLVNVHLRHLCVARGRPHVRLLRLLSFEFFVPGHYELDAHIASGAYGTVVAGEADEDSPAAALMARVADAHAALAAAAAAAAAARSPASSGGSSEAQPVTPARGPPPVVAPLAIPPVEAPAGASPAPAPATAAVTTATGPRRFKLRITDRAAGASAAAGASGTSPAAVTPPAGAAGRLSLPLQLAQQGARASPLGGATDAGASQHAAAAATPASPAAAGSSASSPPSPPVVAEHPFYFYSYRHHHHGDDAHNDASDSGVGMASAGGGGGHGAPLLPPLPLAAASQSRTRRPPVAVKLVSFPADPLDRCVVSSVLPEVAVLEDLTAAWVDAVAREQQQAAAAFVASAGGAPSVPPLSAASSASTSALADGCPVVCLLDYGVTPWAVWLVMERCECSLAAWRREGLAATMPPPAVTSPVARLVTVLHVLQAVAARVAQLHASGVAHYDLKADNLLLRVGGRAAIAAHAAAVQAALDAAAATADYGGGGAAALRRLPPWRRLLPFVCVADFGEGDYRPDLPAGDRPLLLGRGTESIKAPELLRAARARGRGGDAPSARGGGAAAGAGWDGAAGGGSADMGATVGAAALLPPASGCDVWSTGCLAYELAAGAFLFHHDDDWARFFLSVTGGGAGGEGAPVGGASTAQQPQQPAAGLLPLVPPDKVAALADAYGDAGCGVLTGLLAAVLVRDAHARPTAEGVVGLVGAAVDRLVAEAAATAAR